MGRHCVRVIAPLCPSVFPCSTRSEKTIHRPARKRPVKYRDGNGMVELWDECLPWMKLNGDTKPTGMNRTAGTRTPEAFEPEPTDLPPTSAAARCAVFPENCTSIVAGAID